MPGQTSFYRTRVLRLLDAASVVVSMAEEQSDHKPEGRSRPLLPADFGRRVGALVSDLDKRVAAIRDVEVQ